MNFSPYLAEFLGILPSAEFFCFKDAQANVVALLDNTGAVIVKYNYSNGTFPTAPTKLAKSGFVERGLKKAFNYITKNGWSL